MAFTHLDDDGNVAMVDVSSKPGTLRTARAEGRISLHPDTLLQLQGEGMPKGNVLTAAKIAGIQAAKQASALIPLCHQLNLSWVDLSFSVGPEGIDITATARTKEATGVEMEALTAVSVAALTIYDMCKAVDKGMEIGGIRLVSKTGGKSAAPGYRPRTAILVLSDSIAAGTARDRSGEILREGFMAAGCRVEGVRIIADDPAELEGAVDAFVAEGMELIVTSGGTGLGPRDITVDTLTPKFSRRLPGIEQALFSWGQGKTRTAMLSRLAAGVIGDSIVVCLPGSAGAASDALEVLVPSMFHAFSMMKGEGH
ncbi:bifunctional molybdenum cofactor biosynthesis protein MoaC/MoaB [Pelodictyon luteolum]|uniref:Cyclic pyranopterin monophosphate synthase n=1 Tax=Chlorobium luteolum (strain DSM 273 / BCRC 81028 / 2530) TaxID=319225 RepID=Q3B6J3_CHLL3|nr:bifunctional molybdenum cofactor biosynthesis protein MoaC/MoaB [Pelodictyon luteolum]ABB23038.1 GTP cyclohydrolase subunit MoaC [Pelodictyon luteolum DSM 273]